MNEMHKNTQFERHTLLDRQPVQLVRSRGHVIAQTDPQISLAAAF